MPPFPLFSQTLVSRAQEQGSLIDLDQRLEYRERGGIKEKDHRSREGRKEKVSSIGGETREPQRFIITHRPSGS